MLLFYNHVIWFTVCRPIRNKYRLSVNCILCLIGAYSYMQAVNKPFTITNLLKFIPFFNHNRMKYYINVLISKGYLIETTSKNKYIHYTISSLVLPVMGEIEESYNKELVLFCSKYNIEL